MLGDAMLTESFVEAAVHVLRLEVGDYRNSLVSIDQRVRHLARYPDPEQAPALLTELRELNIGWLGKQADAAALCVKSGNAVILRGGKEAAHSSGAIAQIMAEAASEAIAMIEAFLNEEDEDDESLH